MILTHRHASRLLRSAAAGATLPAIPSGPAILAAPAETPVVAAAEVGRQRVTGGINGSRPARRSGSAGRRRAAAPGAFAKGPAPPQVDRAFAAIAVEGDRARRKEAIDAIQAIPVADLPGLPLYLSQSITVFNRRVVNHTVGATGVSASVSELWLRG